MGKARSAARTAASICAALASGTRASSAPDAGSRMTSVSPSPATSLPSMNMCVCMGCLSFTIAR